MARAHLADGDEVVVIEKDEHKPLARPLALGNGAGRVFGRGRRADVAEW